MLRNEFLTKGININPSSPCYGDKVKVVYDGLLTKSGATELYAHVGFGHNWNNSFDYKMTRTAQGFETSIPVSSHEHLNLCFKDAANNWDNNNGYNYTLPVNE